MPPWRPQRRGERRVALRRGCYSSTTAAKPWRRTGLRPTPGYPKRGSGEGDGHETNCASENVQRPRIQPLDCDLVKIAGKRRRAGSAEPSACSYLVGEREHRL